MASIFDSMGGDDSGEGGFFNSPIAMMFMPRVSAAVRESKKQNFLMAQLKRKVELANQFADQIEGQDPQAAAMIRADPTTIDNVWSAWYAADKQRKAAEQGHTYKLDEQANQSALDIQQKKAEGELPGGAGDYRNIMNQFLPASVNEKTQGPNRPGMPTAGDIAATHITPKMAAMALGKDYGLPGLTPGNAMRIMTDPKAAEDLQDNRRADLELGKDTLVVRQPGTNAYHAMGIDPNTGARTVNQGEVAPPAGITEASSRYLDMPDGYRYGFNIDTRAYDRPMGKSPPDANDPRMRVIEKFDETDKKAYIMGWDPDTRDYTRKIGVVPPKGSYTVSVDKDGKPVITYGTGTGSNDRSETEIKGESLWEASKDQYKIALEGFDELSTMRNTTAGVAGDVGRLWMSDEGQTAADSLEQLGTNYIYALSGQQAPKQEVDNFLARLTPLPTDGPKTLRNKKLLLNSAMRAIKSRTREGLLPADMSKAPAWDGTKTVPMPTAEPPPMPKEFSDKGYTKEQWNALEPDDWDAFLNEDN